MCQGGVCQCECSAIQGCDSAGWQLHTIGWDKFAAASDCINPAGYDAEVLSSVEAATPLLPPGGRRASGASNLGCAEGGEYVESIGPGVGDR